MPCRRDEAATARRYHSKIYSPGNVICVYDAPGWLPGVGSNAGDNILTSFFSGIMAIRSSAPTCTGTRSNYRIPSFATGMRYRLAFATSAIP